MIEPAAGTHARVPARRTEILGVIPRDASRCSAHLPTAWARFSVRVVAGGASNNARLAGEVGTQEQVVSNQAEPRHMFERSDTTSPWRMTTTRHRRFDERRHIAVASETASLAPSGSPRPSLRPASAVFVLGGAGSVRRGTGGPRRSYATDSGAAGLHEPHAVSTT
jgi:hypothetical protein